MEQQHGFDNMLHAQLIIDIQVKQESESSSNGAFNNSPATLMVFHQQKFDQPSASAGKIEKTISKFEDSLDFKICISGAHIARAYRIVAHQDKSCVAWSLI
ncbi:unnamed protein product, partial [Nesidiocoris tenuis]